jgi:hypothetical protein
MAEPGKVSGSCTGQSMTIVAAVAISVASTACADQSDAAREARRVFADASPPGSGTCWSGTTQPTGDTFESSCEFMLAADWAQYKRWLRSRMQRQYQTRTDTNEAIGFSRGLQGDLYTVNVALTNNSSTKTVRITFRAAPW